MKIFNKVKLHSIFTKNIIPYSFLFLTVLLTYSCVPPKPEELGTPTIDLRNPTVQQIVRYQNMQQLDSLALFFKHKDPMFRYNATRALGSFATKDAIPYLKELLKDSVIQIRAEAAYAAGQLGDPSLITPVLKAFEKNVESNKINSTNNLHVLEAIGKIGTQRELDFITSAKPYKKAFDTLNLGKALAIYQFGHRDLFSKKGTENMVKMVTEEYPNHAATVAAQYLNRFKKIDLAPYKFQLLQALKKSTNPNVRAALIGALARIGERDFVDPLFEIIKNEKDFRVKINALRNLDKFPYIQVVQKLEPLFQDKNEHVAKAAAQYLQSNGNAGDTYFYMNYAKNVANPSVKRAIYKSILSLIKRNNSGTRTRIANELTSAFKASNDPYERKEIIQTLGNNLYLTDLVKELGFNDNALVVKSAAVEALGNQLSKGLKNYGPITKKSFSTKICNYLNEAMMTGDPGILSSAAYAFTSTPKEFLREIKTEIIKDKFQGLKLPEDIEAAYTLADALEYIDPSQKLVKPKPAQVKEINFDLYNELSDTLHATIQTNKGNITLQLFKKEAPGTVLNFVQLARSDFFTNKYFHRVVPNFVIQAGCPRGDGYGSLDYVIRSDVGPIRYLEPGYIGMASMGLHTECSQFFITQAPTTNLDGRYSIFGKVKTGMDVVNSMHVGDQIKSITIN